ncbi:MAG: hypothetical protein LBR72_01885 [Oscillospiraceae bacterium]|jgi:hypothetical protein|nr:hypothetical protein [Oscillospiraceae bacterium]
MKGTKLLMLALSAAVLLGACAENVAPPPPVEPAAEVPSPTPTPTPTPEPSPTPTPMPDVPVPAVDFSALSAPRDIEADASLPDLFTLLSGETVETEYDYLLRLQELRDLYSYYMYGFMPDTSGEEVAYALDGENLTVSITKDGKTVSFDALVALPDDSVPVPEGGYPVILGLSSGWGGGPVGHVFQDVQYANDQGFAVISYNVGVIATDDSSRTGIFYDLYPYDAEDPFKQTGTLMAWGAWGSGKVIDALENGLGAELNVSPVNTVLTGVSRYGKAAAVGGAFEPRIKVSAPACSGAGGMAMYRYDPRGAVYDFSASGGFTGTNFGAGEHLGSLQSGAEGHWFNSAFLQFQNVANIPLDQHMLAALCGSDGRSLFIIGETDIHWTNPPGMHATFLAAQPAFEFTGAPDKIGINIHWNGHAVKLEDLEKLLPFASYHMYGTPLPFDISEAQTTVFDLEVNRQEALDTLLGR